MKKHYKLIGSAPSLAELIELIEQRWSWSSAKALSVIEGQVIGLRVVMKKSRWRLEREVI